MLSMTNIDVSLMSLRPWKGYETLCDVGHPAGSVPVRVRSWHSRIGRNPGFGCNWPVQSAEFMIVGLVFGLPSALRHTALNVGSTIPNVSCSFRNQCW